jgi:hypothetical protein
MTRDGFGKSNGHLRERIAHLAARIMAEDGIDDFGYAKRKAARQAGARDAGAMPDNTEIEEALELYRSLYQSDQHPGLLRSLREQALTIMKAFEGFNPHLTGPVLTGVAGKHSDIDLQLFAESAKDVEIYLINKNVRHRPGQSRLYLNNEEALLPTFDFEHDGAAVRMTVFDADDLRCSIRATQGGRTLERASISALQALLASEDAGESAAGP